MFIVLACDPNTGTVLDEDLEWYIKDSGKKEFIHVFSTFEEAEIFCIQQIENYSGVDYIIFKDGDDTGTVMTMDSLVQKKT